MISFLETPRSTRERVDSPEVPDIVRDESKGTIRRGNIRKSRADGRNASEEAYQYVCNSSNTFPTDPPTDCDKVWAQWMGHCQWGDWFGRVAHTGSWPRVS